MAKKNNLKLDGIRVVVFDFMNYLKIKMLESGEMKRVSLDKEHSFVLNYF